MLTIPTLNLSERSKFVFLETLIRRHPAAFSKLPITREYISISLYQYWADQYAFRQRQALFHRHLCMIEQSCSKTPLLLTNLSSTTIPILPILGKRKLGADVEPDNRLLKRQCTRRKNPRRRSLRLSSKAKKEKTTDNPFEFCESDVSDSDSCNARTPEEPMMQEIEILSLNQHLYP